MVAVVRLHAMLIIMFLCAVAGYSAETVRLSPSKVIELVSERNAQVKASELEVQGEEYARKGALAALLPSFSLTGLYNRLDEPPTISGFDSGEPAGPADTADTLILPPEYEPYRELITFFDSISATEAQEQMSALFDAGPIQVAPQTTRSVGFKISQPLFTGGALWNRYRVAEYMHEARRLQHERSVQEIRFQALRLFWYYVLGLESYHAIRDEKRWLQELVDNQTVLLENGMITELDLLQTKLALSRKLIDEINVQNSNLQGREQLLICLGLDPALGIEVDTAELWQKPHRFFYPTPDTIEDRLLRRYDLRALEYQVHSLERLKNIQLAAYAPTIAGFYGVDYTNQYGMDEDDFDDQWSVGVSLNWNIFDWGKAWRSMQKYRVQMEAAQTVLEFQRVQLAHAMKSLARTIREARKKVEIARESQQVAERALEIAEARYDQQIATNRDVLDARKDLTRTRMGFVAAKIELILALEEYRIGPVDGFVGGNPDIIKNVQMQNPGEFGKEMSAQ
ncbi:MAG: hypothetical protein GF350_15080 [Chitinivibrionales bacterium]|nr:hypothetical protein [Chitinivibrionales bacterium]